ncbi:phosphatidylglycerol lysyltransferase domain-containing protein [Flavisphingomonas formosensis]|uniref:phosphatidylglycerol lysyltransferase domain-containing protein n=1 Tax=Flavisphingomonas formosensis TaxID=861534 RepID=UPI0012FCBE27|nr:phosphatidylglycerol lysyltransferase domain-containing protein [Sphingomonas formosensis]
MSPAGAAADALLQPADLDRLAALLAECPRRPSEYSLANLWLYRRRHAYRLCEVPLPHLLGRTYDSERHALPLVPLDARDAVRLLDEADCIYPLDEAEAVALASAGRFALDWREADSDYLYQAPHLARLDGAKAKRAQARAFAGEAAPELVPLDLVGEAAALAVLQGWLADVGRVPDATDVAECREAIALRDTLGLDGHVVRTGDGDPVAFLLAGHGAGDSRIVHFAKGRRAFAGAYPWMFARYAAQCGAAWINFEQDLGKPGFAQAKRALAPAARLHKYRVRRARWTG